MTRGHEPDGDGTVVVPGALEVLTRVAEPDNEEISNHAGRFPVLGPLLELVLELVPVLWRLPLRAGDRGSGGRGD